MPDDTFSSLPTWTSGFRSERIEGAGITLRLFREDAIRPDTSTTLPTVLLHGFRDTATSMTRLWQHVDIGGPVFAADWRGHGDSEWIRPGATYHFMDYVADLHRIVRQIKQENGHPVNIVAHSMGGVAATYYAGAVPDSVNQLILLEGVGGPPSQPSDVRERTQEWLRQQDHLTDQLLADKVLTEEEAQSKLQRMHPALSPEILEKYLHEMLRPATALAATPSTETGSDTHEHGDTDILWRWHFDPRHRWRNPYPFLEEAFAECIRAIRARVTLVQGTQSYMNQDLDFVQRRYDLFLEKPAAQLLTIDAGHMMHLENAKGTAAIVRNALLA